MGREMTIAYSTYALQKVDVFEAVARVKTLGYGGLEINCGEGWPTAPSRFGKSDRKRLVEAYREAGFVPPVVMNLIHLCAHDEDTEAKRKELAASCELACDLNWTGEPPVVTTTLGRQDAPWLKSREAIARRLKPYGDLAANHGVVLAIEPHVGQELDSPEKAVWLMDAVSHPNVCLNFDHSHFHVLGMDLRHCAELIAPFAVHTHIKDGRMVDGKVQFLLPGEGTLDVAEYLRVVKEVGINVPITVEVSAQIWRREDYDPWEVAGRCLRAMNPSPGLRSGQASPEQGGGKGKP
jgi:sugar phosphate isomerase/epimerase